MAEETEDAYWDQQLRRTMRLHLSIELPPEMMEALAKGVADRLAALREYEAAASIRERERARGTADGER